MRRIECWIMGSFAILACPAFAEGGVYKVDEDKLPEWVKRQGAAPYKVIMDNATIHIRAVGRAASGAAPKKVVASALSATPASSAVAATTKATTTTATTTTTAIPPTAASASTAVTTMTAASKKQSAKTASTDRPSSKELSSRNAAADLAVSPSPPALVDASSLASVNAPEAMPVVATVVDGVPHWIGTTTRTPSIGVLCPVQTAPMMPRAAAEQNIGGTVQARALVQDGVVKDVTIIDGPRMFHSAVRAAMKTYQCKRAEAAVWVTQNFVFDTE